MKDPNNENGHLFNAVELEAKAVFGRLEEPLIVAPYSEARRGISHVERRPVGDLSEKASDQFSGGTPMEVVYPRCSGFDVHKRFVVTCLLIAGLDRSIARLDREVAERLRRFDALIERLDVVTGLSRRSIEVLLGELGWDMSHFPDAAHAASWVGVCPGNHETGGKQLSGRIRQGNRWAKTVLIQAAHAAGHTRSYLGEQYRRISARRGAKRAAVAVGHSILVIFYHMVKTGESYQEKGVDYFLTADK